NGMRWELQDHISDDFNYEMGPDEKIPAFTERWYPSYHNSWTGPGLTVWDENHLKVADGKLQIFATRLEGTDKVNMGIITSNHRVQYPVYVEARAKISNSVLANAVWMLSPDDTQEIDIIEAYGASYSANADADQTWFAERMHISHHVFIREPFQDYQPKDEGSWQTKADGSLWRDSYHVIGCYWRDPFHLEYYIDGKLVRTVSGEDIIDPRGYTDGTGLNKAMDIIIDMEDHDWRSDNGITPTDEELANVENNTFKVDWIRVYKPVPVEGE
ncbi:MAG: family 16 glycosylhydrolase, partial [Planctomycetota bacterium]